MLFDLMLTVGGCEGLVVRLMAHQIVREGVVAQHGPAVVQHKRVEAARVAIAKACGE